MRTHDRVLIVANASVDRRGDDFNGEKENFSAIKEFREKRARDDVSLGRREEIAPARL